MAATTAKVDGAVASSWSVPTVTFSFQPKGRTTSAPFKVALELGCCAEDNAAYGNNAHDNSTSSADDVNCSLAALEGGLLGHHARTSTTANQQPNTTPASQEAPVSFAGGTTTTAATTTTTTTTAAGLQQTATSMISKGLSFGGSALASVSKSLSRQPSSPPTAGSPQG
jgi:hypothetical protein